MYANIESLTAENRSKTKKILFQSQFLLYGSHNVWHRNRKNVTALERLLFCNSYTITGPADTYIAGIDVTDINT
jgi:hypothetical protein